MDADARYKLLSAFELLKRRTHQLLPGNRMHPAEYFILERLRLTAGHEGGVTVSQLKGHASRPAISQMLNNLEKKGYIERSIAQDDRRQVVVKLTREGEAVLLETKVGIDKSLDLIISRLGAQDFNELLRLMSRLSDIFEEFKGEDIR